MTKRPRGIPHPRIAELVKGAGVRPLDQGGEVAAAAALQRERERRAQTCHAELMELLERHRCTLQVVTQQIQVAGQAGVSQLCQVNVLPLDTPPPPASPAPLPAAENGKPA